MEVLYEAEVARRDPLIVLERRLQELEYSPNVVEFARRLVEGVAEHRSVLDGAIEDHAPGWPLAQVAPVDASILRLAIFELLYGDSPQKVAINEAVELAKRYGTDSSPRFVNGVLGAIVRGYQAAGRG